MKENGIIKDLKWRGFVQFYVALFFDGDTATICKAEFDFSKTITDEVVMKMVESMIDVYSEQGFVINHVQFVNECAYEKFQELSGNNKDIVVTWNEKSIYINGEEFV